jgi:hypothetical protein
MAQDHDKENSLSAQRRGLLPAPGHSGSPSAALEDRHSVGRLPSAYISCTKEWRKIVAAENPTERNIEISGR